MSIVLDEAMRLERTGSLPYRMLFLTSLHTGMRRGEVLDRNKFEQVKDEYYHLRGWDGATGLQTRAILHEMGLEDVAGDLGKRGLSV